MPFAELGTIRLAYETFGRGEPMILIMGIGGQMVLWDEEFCRQLAARGFAVTRFDNRDVGESTILDDCHSPTLATSLGRRLLGQPPQAAYSLDDMAEDVLGLIETLGEFSAHVVGISFGGMIAQCFALKYPHRTRSLHLLMSSSGELPFLVPTVKAFRALIAKVPPSREGAVARQVNLFRVLGHDPHRTPMDRLMDVSGVHYDRGVYPKGFARHFSALLASPGRAKALTKLRIPTLVVHGEKDPLVPPWAGRMLAATIPGARFEFIADMGHDLSPSLWPHVVEAITANAHRPAPMGPLSVEQTIRALTMSASPVAVPER